MEEKSMLLLRELKETLAQVFGCQSVLEGRPLQDCGLTNSLLHALENVLCHGLKTSSLRSFFGGAATPWPWIEGLPASLPDTDALLADVAAAAGSVTAPIARTRLFLRLALNTGALHDCLQALCWNQALCAANYEPHAIVRDTNMQFAFLSRLEPLEVIAFDLETLSIAPILARADYWRTVDFNEPEKKMPETIMVTRKTRFQKKKVSAEAAAAAAEAMSEARKEMEEEHNRKAASEQQQTNGQGQGQQQPQEEGEADKTKDFATLLREKQDAAQQLMDVLREDAEKRRKAVEEQTRKNEEEQRARRAAEEEARRKQAEQERARLAAEYVEEEAMLAQEIQEMDSMESRWLTQLHATQQQLDEVLAA